MVLQDSRNWFADEGQLSKTLCELTDKDVKLSEDDCCACDEAKYNVNMIQSNFDIVNSFLK